MSLKEIYRDDLLNRYASHTFTETVTNDITLVEFKDGSSNVVGRATRPNIDDAYIKIRKNLVGGSEILPILTETQRDDLTSVDTATQIFNSTADRNETYNGTDWISAAGSDVAAPVAFGQMEEINDAGFTIGETWISASEDVVDANGNITFVSDDTNGDYLLVGDDGGGTYRLEFLSCLRTSTGNPVTVQVYLNGVGIAHLKETHATSTSEDTHFDSWEDIVLAAGDKLTLEHSISSGTITAIRVKLELERID